MNPRPELPLSTLRLPAPKTHPNSHPPRASRGRAFTLIELMVATAITSLLLLGMTGVFDQSMKAWRLSSRRADAEREARSALAVIQRDLSGLIVNSNLPIYYNLSRLSTSRLSVATKPTSIQLQVANHPPKSGPNGQDWSNASVVLFFASVQPPSSPDAGNVAGIGYFVTWDPASNEGRGGWNLYRRYQSPSNLMQGLKLMMSNPQVGPYQVNDLEEPEIVGANVLNFWAQPVDITNVAGGRPVGMVTYAQLQAGTSLTNRPKYFQLELTAYGSEQARAFPSREAWISSTNIKNLSRSYIWRVDL